MVDTSRVDELRRRAYRDVESGLLPSCQLALLHRGDVIVEETIGDVAPDSRYLIFSATKVLVASAVWVLVQEGLLDIRQTVQSYVPEFMSEGDPANAATITVEHILIHAGGFPAAPLGHPEWLRRDDRLRAMAQWACSSEPGTTSEYHPKSAHWVLAEIIERLTGRSYTTAIAELVIAPHGLDRLQLGVPEAEQADVLASTITGNLPTAHELFEVFGVRELPPGTATDADLMQLNEPAVRALGVPGGGGVSSALSLARFYDALLRNPVNVWSADMLADATKARSWLPNRLTGVPSCLALGVWTPGADGLAPMRGFGHTCSPSAFGHHGAGGQIAWADPTTDLCFVYLTNGIDRHIIRQSKRSVALSNLAGACAPTHT